MEVPLWGCLTVTEKHSFQVSTCFVVVQLIEETCVLKQGNFRIQPVPPPPPLHQSYENLLSKHFADDSVRVHDG